MITLTTVELKQMRVRAHDIAAIIEPRGDDMTHIILRGCLNEIAVQQDPAAILALINSEDVPSGPVDQEELKQSLESERKTVRTERIAKMCKKIACAMDHPELHHSILYHLQDAHKIAFELWNEAMAARAEAKS